MTYDKIFKLKYKQGLSTYELIRRYPSEINRVNEIALLDVPDSTLRQVVREESALIRLMRLKRRFAKFL